MNIISWNSTNQCHLNCPHCYRDAGANLAKELNTAEAKKMLDQIKAANFHLMIFSGGEPLLRDDIFELISYASEIGLRPVLGSSGGLIDAQTAVKLKEAGVLAAGISLDSVDPQKHNQFRGEAGLFAKVKNAFSELKKVDIPFQTHMTVMDWNLDELEAVIDYSAQVGAKAAHIFFMVPTGRAAYIEENSISKNEYQQAIKRIMKKSEEVEIEVKPVCAPQFIATADQMDIKTRFRNGCLAGESYCIVNPVGDVQPCAYLDLKVGNLRENNFKSIWENSEILNKMRTSDWQGKCGSCKYGTNCRGCRARAYYYSGDFMGADPFCSIENTAYNYIG
ncbi:MAG: radical SAM protein [Halanaerobium sp.]